MTKGTPSKGKHTGGKTHIRCRRCGNHTYHVRYSVCASCGFGRTAKIRSYAWSSKKTSNHMRKEKTRKVAAKAKKKRRAKANKLWKK